MITNRITRYLKAVRTTTPVGPRPGAFMACPAALVPAGWARALYRAAWEQARAEVEARVRDQATAYTWN